MIQLNRRQPLTPAVARWAFELRCAVSLKGRSDPRPNQPATWLGISASSRRWRLAILLILLRQRLKGFDNIPQFNSDAADSLKTEALAAGDIGLKQGERS